MELQIRSVHASACGTERIRFSSLFVIDFDTSAEYPPIKFTPTSFAALSNVFAIVTKSSGLLHAAPPISATGVIEIRLFTIGIPNSCSISSPVFTRSFATVVINVGVSGPGVVKHAIEQVRGKGFEELCETIKKTAFKVTRVGQLVAGEASKRLGIPFGIIDLSLAPTPAVGDSVAEILEEIGLERVGAPGTTAALAMLNDQVKKGGVMASSYVGGLSGAFIPVSEDKGMIDAVEMGALTIEKLEAMTCVCSVGLDMIAIPGKTTASTVSGIIADEMAIGMVNQKTTAVRLIPVIGKDVGETAEFGGLLGYAPIIPVNEYDCSAFVNRKGRIPAPVHSFKN